MCVYKFDCLHFTQVNRVVNLTLLDTVNSPAILVKNKMFYQDFKVSKDEHSTFHHSKLREKYTESDICRYSVDHS